MFGAYSYAGRNPYHSTPVVTRASIFEVTCYGKHLIFLTQIPQGGGKEVGSKGLLVLDNILKKLDQRHPISGG
jgi:hypothetical protein